MNATLLVPFGTKEKYESTGGWKEFVFIQEVDPATLAIDPIRGEVEETARFTLDGKPISSPQRGINIIRMSDGTIKKILVK